MSLIAWYPLHEDTEDWSGNNNVALNGTIVSGGKIGKCLDKSSPTTNLGILANELGDFSTISFWVKQEFATGRTAPFFGTSVNGAARTYDLFQYPDVGDLHGSFSGGSNWVMYDIFSDLQWTHVVITGNLSGTKVYKDGVLFGSSGVRMHADAAPTSPLGFKSGNLQVNDFRLYSHELSIAEIKKLSMAKVLHYNFNQRVGGSLDNVNITWTSHSPYNSISAQSDTSWATLILETAHGYVAIHRNHTYQTGDRVRISGFISVNDRPMGIDNCTTYATTDYYENDPETGWFSVVEVFTSASGWLFHAPLGTARAGDTVKCWDIKVENLTTDSGVNEVVEDISGLGHDAALGKDAPGYTFNAGLGSGGYHFPTVNRTAWNDIQQKIQTSFTHHNSRQVTVAIWARHGNLGTMRSPLAKYDQGVWSSGQASGGAILLCIESNKFRMHGWGSGDPICSTVTSDNEWHHFVWNFDYDTRRMNMYVDGVKEVNNFLDTEGVIQPLTNYFWCIGGNNGAYASTTAYTYNGDISDVQIYTTVLSDEDVLGLATVKGSVERNGNFYVNEIVESDSRVFFETTTVAICDHQPYSQLWATSSAANYASSIDFSSWVESDNTLGNISMSGWVYITNTSHIPTTFEYTRANNDMGFYFYINDHTDWVVGWNYFYITRVSWDNAANTDWTNMNRLEIYGSNLNNEALTGVDSIIFKDFRIQKIQNNKLSPNVTRESILMASEIREIGYKPSLIDYSTWVVGATSATGFSRNGSSSETIIEYNTNPWGEIDVIWASRNNDTASGADGGFNGSVVSIDRTKTHRFSIWIKREVTGNGTWYFGCSDSGGDVQSLSGADNTNPYFRAEGGTYSNDWFLVVGYVYPTGTTATAYFDDGVYNVSGTKLVSGTTDFRCNTGTTSLGLRSYLYYSTDPTTVQFFYRPRIDCIEDGAPTLQELISGAEHPSIVHEYDVSGSYSNTNSRFNSDGTVMATEFREI